MSFTEEQKAAMAAKLDGAHVKTRSQAGKTLSYIEGWQAIAEANRIFGFDGWSRETVDTVCVWSGERETKTGLKPAASYICKVRVSAGGVVREGTGSGSGFGKEDVGEAHESAVKEAETDAMKRALITFGNPFGLALYDKDQHEVERTNNTDKATRPGGALSVDPIAATKAAMENEAGRPLQNQYQVDKAKKNGTPTADAERLFVGLALESHKVASTKEDLSSWWKANLESMDKLSDRAHEAVLRSYDGAMDRVKARA